MVNYYNSITDPSTGYVYSVDNLRINFSINPHHRDDFEGYINALGRTDITSFPPSFKDFQFKYLYQISYQGQDHDVHKLTLGYILNGSETREDVKKGYIDVNPNKTASDSRFWGDLAYIKHCCEDWEIVRVDIAVDIPVERANIVMVKDNRKYSLTALSNSNKTEYLGRRNTPGYVKVYNKQEESNTPGPLTRIEVTCKPTPEDFYCHIPKCYDITAGGQLSMDIMALNDTDLAILRLCLSAMATGSDAGLMFFNSLARRKKEKIRPFLLPDSSLVVFSSSVVLKLFKSLQVYNSL